MPIIRVALDVPLSTLFDYKVNDAMHLEIGQRVVVRGTRKEVATNKYPTSSAIDNAVSV